MCSVQSILLSVLLYSLSIMSVQLHSVPFTCQWDSVYAMFSVIVSAQFYSIKCKQCPESIASVQFLKHSVYRVESVAYSMVFTVSWISLQHS